MKMLRRVSARRSIPSSGGGSAGPIAWTTPSAGLITNPGRTGVTRGGSLKK
jgi:hypothetical protein